MNTKTRVLIGVAILALGGATLWLAATQSEASVRQVGDVIAAPESHARGSFTLVGVPEPQQVPVTGAAGVALQANPEWRNETRTTISWMLDGKRVYSTHVLRATPDVAGHLVWTFRNETRRTPADAALLLPAVQASWTWGDATQAFTVEAFTSGAGGAQRIWAYYPKATEHPIQPKPSQFTGHLVTATPDGQALPAGALIWSVDEYTAGCSSKFLPPEAQAKYNVTADQP